MICKKKKIPNPEAVVLLPTEAEAEAEEADCSLEPLPLFFFPPPVAVAVALLDTRKADTVSAPGPSTSLLAVYMLFNYKRRERVREKKER